MIGHIFILLWNQKRRYVGILLEQALVFIVLTVCLVSLLGAVERYRSPGLLDTKNVITFGYMMHTDYSRQDVNLMSQQLEVIIENLRKKDYVKAVSESGGFVPYMRPDENYWSDSLSLSPERKIYVQFSGTDESADEVFNIEMVDGRWFTDDEKFDGRHPVVVTTQFVESAGIDRPVGRMIGSQSQYQIVGVIEGWKTSVFTDAQPAVIFPLSVVRGQGFYKECVARIEPGYEEDFYSDYLGELNRLSANMVDKVEPTIHNLNKWRNQTMTDTVTEVAFLAIPTIFLLIFAFIGTMGLTLMNLKSRIPELAVRMAVGSTNGRLMQFVVLQNLAITLIAVIPGCVIALSAYEYTAVNLTALGLAVSAMLLFSVLSSWYPARTIARLSPAKALKYE